MTTVTNVITDVITYGPQVIAAAAIIAAITPTPVDDGIVATLRKLIDLLAFNWGHAAKAKKSGE